MPPNSSVGDVSLTACNNNILTRGRAWAIALSQRSTVNEEISEVCFLSSKDGMDERLLYRFASLTLNLGLITLCCFNSIGHLFRKNKIKNKNSWSLHVIARIRDESPILYYCITPLWTVSDFVID